MQANDQIINQMLRNLPQDQQNQFAAILRNDVAFEVICNTEDQYRDIEVEQKDEDGNAILYKTGEKKGQPKTTTEPSFIISAITAPFVPS